MRGLGTEVGGIWDEGAIASLSCRTAGIQTDLYVGRPTNPPNKPIQSYVKNFFQEFVVLHKMRLAHRLAIAHKAKS